MLKASRPSQPESLESRVDHLRAVSLFEDIKTAPAALEALARSMEEKTFAAQTNIITEGEMGSEMFLLVEGSAAVLKSTSEGESYKVVILTAGFHPFFGEGGLLDKDARSATIRAESTCRCLVLSREAFDQFARENPNWALPILLRIARAVLGRLKKSNTDLMLLYNALLSEIRGT